MTENTCEHEWDESEDIDNFLDLVDLNPQFVQSKLGAVSAVKQD